ncbi:C4-dicarboxylate ABC transporter permease [Peribacillus sp. NJ4]|uniref:YfcC family protein n=1 Tax=Peribacillus TaxID=2675229 RepID=UPI0025A27983|nr:MULTISPECIES: C4-dicarboxylate ABC transporter permease [unclassified Peribacillus]MDM5212850.1 C4-dicarboxylate ABC transporter permease [Peribacillus sp. NJ4]MDM5223241.1 C4-dicarboxylate ABC transporter permease [Peribacillus sp. NJ11]
MSQIEEKVVSLGTAGKKERKINVFVLLLCILAIATLFTYILPAGEYARIEADGRTTVDASSFKWIESAPVGMFDMIKAIHTGMVEAGNIIFFLLIIGGFFGVLRATGTVDVLIATMARKLATREKLLIPVVMLFFAVGGSLMGMAEETLAYLPLIIPLALALGFDTITGTAIVIVGALSGFTTAIMNPFTVGLAQGIAELPMFSGIGLRLILFFIVYIVSVLYIYRHAMKVKKNPSIGIYGKYTKEEAKKLLQSSAKLTARHKFILGAFLINYIVLAFGVIKFQWYMTEIAALFIVLTIVIGIIGKLSADHIVNSFTNGSAALLGGALIIGVSRAILVVLNEGHIVDPMLHQVAESIQHIPAYLSVAGMYSFQTIIHFILASGTGHAMLTMPVMVPLADLLDITRQTAVLSFSFADGIGNMIFPTATTLMAGLAIAGIPWTKWAKWILPLVLIQYLIGLIAVITAHFIGYGPF